MSQRPAVVRSYQRLFRPDRRIYAVDGRTLPIPGGLPLRWLAAATVILLVVLALAAMSPAIIALAGAVGAWSMLRAGRRRLALPAATVAAGATLASGVILTGDRLAVAAGRAPGRSGERRDAAVLGWPSSPSLRVVVAGRSGGGSPSVGPGAATKHRCSGQQLERGASPTMRTARHFSPRAWRARPGFASPPRSSWSAGGGGASSGPLDHRSRRGGLLLDALDALRGRAAGDSSVTASLPAREVGLRYARANLLFGPGAEAAALYRLATVNYPLLGVTEKWGLLRQLERLVHVIGADFSLWRVARATTAQEYEPVLGRVVGDRDGAESMWRTLVSGHRDAIAELAGHTAEVYLAVRARCRAPARAERVASQSRRACPRATAVRWHVGRGQDRWARADPAGRR